MNLSRQIVSEIAVREDVDPVDLDPRLGQVVNTDLLDAIAADSGHRGEVSPTLEFEYHGYTVTIDSGGEVDISDPARVPNEHPRTMSNRSLGTSTDEASDRERAMKNAADIIAARERPFADRLDGLLHVVRNTLKLDAATLSYVDDGSYVFEAVDVTESVGLHTGEIVPLTETACKRVVETEQALVLRDIKEEAPELANSTLAIASYLGVPVFVDGDVYGTFCFYDEEPRAEEFSDWELAFVELLGNWVSSELERRQREWALQRRSSERPHNPS